MVFKMTDLVFLIESMRYEQAAKYILREVFGEKLYDIGPRDITLKRKQIAKIAKELQKQHKLVRKQYPDRITRNQMREIAVQTYDQTCQTLDLYKYIDSATQI